MKTNRHPIAAVMIAAMVALSVTACSPAATFPTPDATPIETTPTREPLPTKTDEPESGEADMTEEEKDALREAAALQVTTNCAEGQPCVAAAGTEHEVDCATQVFEIDGVQQALVGYVITYTDAQHSSITDARCLWGGSDANPGD